MNSFIRTKVGSECPICSDATGKCRSKDAELFLCMTAGDSRLGDVINGYVCTKEAKSSNWASFVENRDTKNIDPQKHADDIARMRARVSEGDRQKKSLYAAGLNADERNNANRLLLSGLIGGLDARDADDLKRRGLSTATINKFKSVGKWQRLPFALPARTPAAAGSTLHFAHEGYLVPCTDVQGRVLGFQVRNRNPGPDAPKYPWMSTQKNPANLQNGELPITFCDGDRSIVNLSEGILKPLVAAELFGQSFIGASGGNFNSSKEQLQSFLAEISPKIVALCPDGEAQANPSVMRQYGLLQSLMNEWGYDFKVRWWGQFTKADGDIDEISPQQFAESKLITWNEYQAIALSYAPPALPERQPEPIFKTTFAEVFPLTATPGFIQNYGPLINHVESLKSAILNKKLTVIRSGTGTCKTLLVSKIVEALHDADTRVVGVAHRERLGEYQAALYGLPYKIEIMEFGGSGDYLGFVITADSCHPRSKMKFKGSDVNTNTVMIIDEVDQVLSHIANGQTAVKDFRKDIVTELSIAMHNSAHVIVMSADVTDTEVELIQSVAGIAESDTLKIVNTYKRNYGSIYQHDSDYEIGFMAIQTLREGKRFIMKCSGQEEVSTLGTTNLARYLRAEFPDKKGLVLDSFDLNDPSNTQTHIEHIPTSRSEDGFDCCHVKIEEDENGVKTFVPRTEVVGILAYISHTDPAVKEARQKEIFNQYDWVLFTNACSTGISIEQGKFTHFFMIERGIGSVADATQAIARYRPTDISRHVFVAEQGLTSSRHGNGSTSANELIHGQNSVFTRSHKLMCEAGGAEELAWLPQSAIEGLTPIGRIWGGFKAMKAAEFNAESYEFNKRFKAKVKADGYQLRVGFCPEWANLTDSEQTEFKLMMQAVRDRTVQTSNVDTAAVETKDVDAKALRKSDALTAHMRMQLCKLNIIDQFGLTDEEVTPELVNAYKRGLSSRLNLRLNVEQGIKATALNDRAKLSEIFDKGIPFLSDVNRKTQAHKVQILEAIGIPSLLAYLRGTDEDGNPNVIHNLSPQVEAIAAALSNPDIHKAMEHSLDFKAGRIITVDNPDGTKERRIEIERPVRVIKTLLGRMELDIKSIGQRRVDGQKAHHFILADKLIKERPDGTTLVIADYERFKAARLKRDTELKANEKGRPLRSLDLEAMVKESANSSEGASNALAVPLVPYRSIKEDIPVLTADSVKPISLANSSALTPQTQNSKSNSPEIEDLTFQIEFADTFAEFLTAKSALDDINPDLFSQLWPEWHQDVRENLTNLAAQEGMEHMLPALVA